MKKQKIINYDRNNDQLEVASVHPNLLQEALKEITSCLKGLDIKYMGMFGTVYLEEKLSDDDVLMINLTLSDGYKIVTEGNNRSKTKSIYA